MNITQQIKNYALNHKDVSVIILMAPGLILDSLYKRIFKYTSNSSFTISIIIGSIVGIPLFILSLCFGFLISLILRIGNGKQ